MSHAQNVAGVQHFLRALISAFKVPLIRNRKKCIQGEVFICSLPGRGNNRQGSICRGCVWLGKCPSGECSSGIYLAGDMPLAVCLVGKLSVRDVSGNREANPSKNLQ